MTSILNGDRWQDAVFLYSGERGVLMMPQLVRRQVEAKLRAFCERQVPPEGHGDMRVKFGIRGNSATIEERRPAWPDVEGDWIRLKVAQLRFDPNQKLWTLWWPDRNQRWHRYWDVDATDDLDELLEEIDQDPTGIFWG